MIPDECKMPDLSDLLKTRLEIQTMIHALVGDPGISRREGSYRRNFTRLVDKSIREYDAARQAIINDIEERKRSTEVMLREGRVIFILAFTDHFENCVNAINRLLKLLDRLKSEELSAAIPREARRAIEAHSRDLTGVRNAVEHIDEMIQNDEIGDGQPIVLFVGGDGDRAVIGPHEVSFDRVANTIRNLHHIGHLLFQPKKAIRTLRSATAQHGSRPRV